MRRFNNLPSAENAKIQTFGYPATTTHLHNAHVGSESDGFPMDFMEPGEIWDHHYALIYARHDAREALGSLRSEEQTYELQSLMRTSYDVFCYKNNNKKITTIQTTIKKIKNNETTKASK